MQPETVVAGLVARHYPNRTRQGGLRLFAPVFNESHKPFGVTSLQAMQADLVDRRRVQGHKPGRLAQFQRHENCGSLLVDGRQSNG
ncbi:hypothetical protein [Mesorhizobium sp. M1329]|uniref:hypothetical protein n=1 Tax=Mesorhizobium sp. M1329 TaxID=2957083 RepID=UPI00333AAC19